MKLKLFGFVALFLSVALLFSLSFSYLDALARPKVAAATAPKPVIILDAGHGGEDGGAVGVNGVLEKELNLSVSKTLAVLLRMAGHTVVETRTDDRLLYPVGTKKGHKKSEDLRARLAFTDRYPDSVLISLHMNTYPTPNCEGTQIWYSPNHPDSAKWASALQNGIKAHLQPSNRRKIKPATGAIYLLHRAKTPAVLIECGFLSTPTDCKRLSDPQYLFSMSLSIFLTIHEKIT